ncbi:MAG: carbohydrate kinase family protein, partial [Armatimonadota bacterium]
GYSIIFTSPEGDRTILCYRGANNRIRPSELPQGALQDARWVYVSSLSGESGRLLWDIAELTQSHGARMALNPGSAQIREGLQRLQPVLSTVDVLCLNRREAAMLTGIGPLDAAMDAGEPGFDRGHWAAEVRRQLHRLIECGPEIVVITDGANGSCATDGSRCWMIPAIPAEHVFSSVGAGDAYCSAFVAEVMRSGQVPRAMLLGAANATSVIQSLGAKGGILSYEEAGEVAGAHADAVEEVV